MTSEQVPSAIERRARGRIPVTEAWSTDKRDAWRAEAFKTQIAHESQLRRERANLHIAVWAGIGIGIVGAGVSLFY